MMTRVGYAHLSDMEGVMALPLTFVSEVRSVTRKEWIGDTLAIPSSMAPSEGDVLGHVLFAIKHEGINLQILSQALQLVPEEVMISAYQDSPTGQYIRKACYLWEAFAKKQLSATPSLKGVKYFPLFDPDAYITTSGIKDPRWRVTFNGLGTLDYCVTVRRTDTLQAQLDKGLLKQASDFTESLPSDILNRTLAWAYLHETKDSYAIEKESPSEDKATRFVNLLRQAHTKRQLTEEYLVELHNTVISNPFEKAASFRIEQNYLSNGLRGPLGITYIPPSPYLTQDLMVELMDLVNNPPGNVDPLVLASIVSFAFVFIHPFMDGNGRLSRFLFHHVLCQCGSLPNGLVLPVSSVLKQNEAGYLSVLQEFSEPTRRFWEVSVVDDTTAFFDFKGHESIYRYWDATSCVLFMANAAESAIEHHLKEETVFLHRYDQIYKMIDREYDVANKDLSRLVMFCMDQNGNLSKNRRKQYQDSVPEEVFDALEAAYREVVNN